MIIYTPLSERCSQSRVYGYMGKYSIFSIFLVTKKLPYVVTRDVCPSVRLSIHPSARPSVRRAVRPPVRLSSVEIYLKRGSKRSAELIDLKIGLNMDN